EAAQRESPGDSEIRSLLRTTREAYIREKQVADCLVSAARIQLDQGPDAAVALLEERLTIFPDPRLRQALTNARRHAQPLKQRIDRVLEEANQILSKHGAREARDYLGAQQSLV